MLKKKGLLNTPNTSPLSFDGYITVGQDANGTKGYVRGEYGTITPNTSLLVAVTYNLFSLWGAGGLRLDRGYFVREDGLLRAYKVLVEGNNFSGECVAVPDATIVGDLALDGYFVYSDSDYTICSALPDRIRLTSISDLEWNFNISFPMKRHSYQNNKALFFNMYSGPNALQKINPIDFSNASVGDKVPFKLKILEEVFS